MGTAPYHADVASGPPGARAVWVTTADGVRLRAVTWPREGTSRGTVLLLQGRTEWIEKYSDAARALSDRGFASASIDWRGQGLSPRSGDSPRIGHVDGFDSFQPDVDALLDLCRDADMPRPWSLLAHSMGGLIGLRALSRRPELRRVAFSAPMWGLALTPQRRAAGWGASAAATLLGFGGRAAPGSGNVADPAAAAFADNLLTSDPAMFAWMKHQIVTYPELSLGAPSLGWVWSAFREMHRLARDAAPQVPCLAFVGTREAVVSTDAIHVRMGSWENARLETVEGARHEVLMERPEIRARVFDAIAGHLGGDSA